MHMMGRTIMKSRFSSIACFLGIFNSLPLFAQDAYLCVWRNPERTMTRIFPEAKDYKTVNNRITEELREAIEKRLGFALLPGQRDQFQYFEMTDETGKRIGTIIAASQKGEYGAVEFVFGMDTANVINGIYIQRSRERDTRFKDRRFLDLFTGKKPDDALSIGKAYKGEKNKGTEAVIRGLQKELVTYEALVVKQRR
jgi:hypothetical protein